MLEKRDFGRKSRFSCFLWFQIMFFHRAYPGPPAVKGDAPLASLVWCEFSRHSTWASYNPVLYWQYSSSQYMAFIWGQWSACIWMTGVKVFHQGIFAGIWRFSSTNIICATHYSLRESTSDFLKSASENLCQTGFSNSSSTNLPNGPRSTRVHGGIRTSGVGKFAWKLIGMVGCIFSGVERFDADTLWINGK